MKNRHRYLARQQKSSLFSQPEPTTPSIKIHEQSVKESRTLSPSDMLKRAERTTQKDHARELTNSHNHVPGWDIRVKIKKGGPPTFLAKCQTHRDRHPIQVSKYNFENRNFVCKACRWEKSQLEKREVYYSKVRRITEATYLAFKTAINPLNLVRGSEYHLDHIYSIRQGFEDGVPPEIIGSWPNLRMISGRENCSKGETCHISLNELQKRYDESKKPLV